MYENLGPKERLSAMKGDFIRHLEFYKEIHDEKLRAQEFHHNSDGRGQWTEDELGYLEDRGRPALTWNIGAKYVRQAVGLSQANAMEPKVVGTGGDDELTEEVMTKLLRALRSDLRHEEKDRRIDLDAHVGGEGLLHLHASPDPRNPSEIEIAAKVVCDREILWDMDSRETDRSDARFFFWPRWVTKSEWLRDYPEKADEWEHFKDSMLGVPSGDALHSQQVVQDTDLIDDLGPDDYNSRRYFYDRKTHKARLIHVEYERPVRKIYAVNLESGLSTEIDEKREKAIARMHELQVPEFAVIEVRKVWDTEVYWLEFALDEILFDGPSPQPFDGFSLVPRVFAMDQAVGVTYGLWRNYFDPQRETNKRHSSLLEMLALQARPGTDAEVGAVPDQSQFEEATAGNDPVRYVEDGVLGNGRIRDRQPPQIPAGTLAAMEVGRTLFQEVGISNAGMDSPAAGQEAAFTVQIRQEWTKLDLLLYFDQYKCYQRETARKELQIALRSFPDSQVARMLGNEGRYRVQGNVVFVLSADGQQVEGEVSLSSLRDLQYDIDFESGSKNPAQRASLFNGYLQMLQSGVPVAPELLYESATPSVSDQETLKRFAMEQAQAQSQQSQQQQEQLSGLLEAQAQTEQIKASVDVQKASETTRHNMADEIIRLLGIWEKADAREKAEIQARIQSLTAAPVGV